MEALLKLIILVDIRTHQSDAILWTRLTGAIVLLAVKGTTRHTEDTFLLQYAKENFDTNDRRCLYVNMNNFYFQGRGIATLLWTSTITAARCYSSIRCSNSRTGAASFASATTNVLT